MRELFAAAGYKELKTISFTQAEIGEIKGSLIISIENLQYSLKDLIERNNKIYEDPIESLKSQIEFLESILEKL